MDALLLAPDPVVPRLLAVDDEPNVLAALRRAMRPRGIELATADSAAHALDALAQAPFDAVISDMRMPGMNGVEFLGEVRARWPQVVRILLTGHADLASTIDAVNRGEIFRYLTKPWNDAELLRIVDDGLARLRLERERDRLRALAEAQNEQLKLANARLETQVAERTAQLRQALADTEALHQSLKQGFLATVRSFASVIEARLGQHGLGRHIAAHVRAFGPSAGLRDAALQDTIFAALLHDLGKLALPDRVITRAVAELDAEDRRLFLQHPQHGAGFLFAIEPLQGAAAILRALHERYDGRGLPEGAAGDAIPLGARVLAVVGEYEAMLRGAIQRRIPSQADALARLKRGRGGRFDPDVLDAFAAYLDVSVQRRPSERRIRPDQLEPGMVLARDLLSPQGVLLLARDHLLDAALVQKIRRFADLQAEPIELAVYLREAVVV